MKPEAKAPRKAYVTELLEAHQGPAIAALAKEGKMTGKDVVRVIKQYRIDVERVNPDGA